MALPTYAVISPVRDEAEHLPRTAESLLAQTHRPLQWVIVDDGSTDGTGRIAERYAAAHDWIDVVQVEGTHPRARGAPIVRAFEAGRARLRRRPELTVKLDGDLHLPSHYFEWVASVFARCAQAGIVGATVLVFDGDGWVPDRGGLHNVNGVAKAYRTRCLEEIGGLRPSMGWDGIDDYGARARGWQVHVLSELTILHYRRRGSKQAWWRARFEEGQGNHYMGYLPLFLIVRAGYRMLVERPPVAGGLALAAGYAWSALRRLPQVDDADARTELRAEQAARLRGLARGRSAVQRPQLQGGGPAFW